MVFSKCKLCLSTCCFNFKTYTKNAREKLVKLIKQLHANEVSYKYLDYYFEP